MIGFRSATIQDLVVAHQVEVNPLSGAARVSVPIPTSPGRESFGPSLSLSYGSGDGNSSFGVGWVLSGVPSIGLATREHLPSYLSIAAPAAAASPTTPSTTSTAPAATASAG